MENKDSLHILDFVKDLVYLFNSQSRERRVLCAKTVLRMEYMRRVQPFASSLGIDTIEAAVLLIVLIDRAACSALPRQVSEFFGEDANDAIEKELNIIMSAKAGALSKYLDVDDLTIRNRSYTFKETHLYEIQQALESH